MLKWKGIPVAAAIVVVAIARVVALPLNCHVTFTLESRSFGRRIDCQSTLYNTHTHTTLHRRIRHWETPSSPSTIHSIRSQAHALASTLAPCRTTPTSRT